MSRGFWRLPRTRRPMSRGFWRLPRTRRPMSRGFWRLFAASTLCLLANGTLVAMLPLFVRDELGGDAADVGLIVGGAALAAMALRPVAGALTDRYGRRRATMAGALVVAAGALTLLLASSLLAGATGRLAATLGSGTMNTATTVWVVEAAAVGERGRVLSILGVSVWIGFGLGPPLGELLLHEVGFTAVWLATSAMCLAALAIVATLSELPRPAVASAARGDWRAVVGAVLRPAAAGALAWGAQGILLAFLLLHLQERGIGAPSTILTAFAVSVIAARLVLARAPDRFGPALVAAASMAVGALGLLLLAAAGTYLVAAGGALLLGVGFAVLQPSLTLIALDRLDPGRRATGTGLFIACMDVGVAAGTTAGGVVAASRGEAAALVLAAVLTAAGAALVVGMRSARVVHDLATDHRQQDAPVPARLG